MIRTCCDDVHTVATSGHVCLSKDRYIVIIVWAVSWFMRENVHMFAVKGERKVGKCGDVWDIIGEEKEYIDRLA